MQYAPWLVSNVLLKEGLRDRSGVARAWDNVVSLMLEASLCRFHRWAMSMPATKASPHVRAHAVDPLLGLGRA